MLIEISYVLQSKMIHFYSPFIDRVQGADYQKLMYSEYEI